jgi:hypothetical protein
MDGDITANIVVVNPVDIHNSADYIITYNVTDAAGNAADQVTRTVHVHKADQDNNGGGGGGGGGNNNAVISTTSAIGGTGGGTGEGAGGTETGGQVQGEQNPSPEGNGGQVAGTENETGAGNGTGGSGISWWMWVVSFGLVGGFITWLFLKKKPSKM